MFVKKIILSSLFLLLSVFQTFALVDTDSDGVSDETDICPRVYSRSTNGCPTLTAVIAINTNSCISTQIKSGKIVVTVTPICDATTKVCPKITNIIGAQSCDPLFPVIFDTTGSILVRGSVYIIDYTK